MWSLGFGFSASATFRFGLRCSGSSSLRDLGKCNGSIPAGMSIDESECVVQARLDEMFVNSENSSLT